MTENDANVRLPTPRYLPPHDTEAKISAQDLPDRTMAYIRRLEVLPTDFPRTIAKGPHRGKTKNVVKLRCILVAPLAGTLRSGETFEAATPFIQFLPSLEFRGEFVALSGVLKRWEPDLARAVPDGIRGDWGSYEGALVALERVGVENNLTPRPGQELGPSGRRIDFHMFPRPPNPLLMHKHGLPKRIDRDGLVPQLRPNLGRSNHSPPSTPA